jgi:hypothetical protein
VEDSPNTSNGRLPQESPPTREDRVEGELTIVNEFTAVRVRKVATRNGERLEISSLRFDGSIRLQDPEVIGSFLEQPYGPEPKE